MPGVHDVGVEFTIHANKSYYIPGNAVVFGTFTGDEAEDGDNIHIYGHGTLSQDKIPHPKYSDYPPEDPKDYDKYKSIRIKSQFCS